jgi:hypothetical protein
MGGRLHFALSNSRRASPLRERPSLKLASAAGLSKLNPAIKQEFGRDRLLTPKSTSFSRNGANKGRKPQEGLANSQTYDPKSV